MTLFFHSFKKFSFAKHLTKMTAFMLLIVWFAQVNAAVKYVNINATGTGTGASWLNAYTNLATAINNATNGDEIWVAKGTYQPANGTSFLMKNDVKIYGGFNGGEATLQARNWRTNVTILKGNNSRVIYNNSSTNATLLDGFTVTGGDVSTSSGGGVYNDNSPANFANCIFSGNIGSYGGAVGNYASSPTFTNCTFSGNTANYGGGMDNNISFPTLINCAIFGNTANFEGAAIYNYSGESTLINVTVANNGVLAINNGSGSEKIIFKNSIIWDGISGGYTASNSLLKALNPSGTANIDATTLTENDVFTDYTNANYSLKQTSPALNKGNNTFFAGLSAASLDLAGNVRVYDYNNSGIIDLGAYEYQGAPPVLPVKLVDYTAKIDGNSAKLEWQTSSEIDNRAFLIYRKGDGGDFTILDRVLAATGSNFGGQQYQYIDKQPLNGNNYYQLAQEDFNGTITILGQKGLRFSLATADLNFYPNPTKEKIFLNSAVEGTFTLFNGLGQKISSGSAAQLNAGLDISSLQAGLYYLNIQGKSYKIVKQ